MAPSTLRAQHDVTFPSSFFQIRALIHTADLKGVGAVPPFPQQATTGRGFANVYSPAPLSSFEVDLQYVIQRLYQEYGTRLDSSYSQREVLHPTQNTCCSSSVGGSGGGACRARVSSEDFFDVCVCCDGVAYLSM